MTAWQQNLRRRFDRAAAGYDALAQLQQQSAQRLLMALQPVLASSPKPLNILDVGSGTGWLIKQLQAAQPSAWCCALDLSEGMLRSPSAGANERVQRVCADASVLPMASSAFDLVVSNFALHWCDDPLQVLNELHRVCVPGGQAFCVIPVSGSLSARGDTSTTGASLLPLATWQQALAASPWTLRQADSETYEEFHDSPTAWLSTLRALGVTAQRPAASVNALSPRQALQQLHRRLESAREPAGIPLRYEVWRIHLQA